MTVAASVRWPHGRHELVGGWSVTEAEEAPVPWGVRKALGVLDHHAKADVAGLKNALPNVHGAQERDVVTACTNAHGAELFHQLSTVRPDTGFPIRGERVRFYISVEHLRRCSWHSIEDAELAGSVVPGADVFPLTIA